MTSDLQFISWSRRGIGAAPTVGQHGSRRLVTTSLTVTADRQGQDAQTAVQLDSAPLAVLGPGDVIGVPGEQIVRRSPRPDSHNLEPNYLVAIEFAHPDLPWLFSPAAAVGEQLQPWLMLLVFDRATTQLTARAGSPNPVIVLADPGSVPDPALAWAWAHAQVHGTDAGGAKAALLGSDPVAANIRSRVLCPTRLLPDHDYLAALVPTYEAGRRVGIGDPETDAGAAPWVPAGSLVLPVYDSWRFSTGPAGDFESLARKLRPVTGQFLQHLGQRLVTIEPRAALMQRADAAPDLFAPGVYAVPTAIAKDDQPGPLAPDAATPAPQADAFHRRLKELVDIVAAATDDAPIVGPPLYGKWPAVVSSLDGAPGTPQLAALPGGAQTWIEQLNADPYLRTAAGVATHLVQHDQEPLMTDAWSQLSAVLAANARMRWARLYASSGTFLHQRLDAATSTSALRTTAPAFGRVLASPALTVRAAVEATTLPREALGSAFVRVARYGVIAAARDAVTRSSVTTVTDAVEAIRTSAPAVLPTRFTTARAIDPGLLQQVLSAPELADGIRQRLGADPAEYLQRINDVPVDVRKIAERFQDADVPPAATQQLTDQAQTQVRITPDQLQQVSTLSTIVAHPTPAARLQLQPAIRDELVNAQHLEQPSLSLQALSTVHALAAGGVAEAGHARVDLTSDAVQIVVAAQPRGTLSLVTKVADLPATQELMVNAGDSLRSAALTNLGVTTPTFASVVGELNDADNLVLRTGFDLVAKLISRSDAQLSAPGLATFDLDTKKAVVAALEPEGAYSKMLAYAHHNISPLVTRRPDSQFHPAMASPVFPQPLVERLKVLDENWVLGGVNTMPANSICLLAINWRFVESFLAGANHEMARELLWRGYPTDLRGSCFRQFWGAPTPDIRPMDQWLGNDIGQHSEGPARHELTMVVIKGDLLRRYPNTLVSAEKGTASADPNDPQFTSDNEFGRELFRGFLGQDVTYVALDIAIDTLRKPVDGANPRHSWYLSLLEPHDEPRFGLDEQDGDQPPNAAPDLSAQPDVRYAPADKWSWQGVRPAGLRQLTPDAVFARNSSAVVGASLFQRPFRLLLHAPDYLPSE